MERLTDLIRKERDAMIEKVGSELCCDSPEQLFKMKMSIKGKK